MTPDSDGFYSTDEAEIAIGNLSAPDVVKIRQFARARLVLKPTDMSEDELLQEAILRTLQGKRHWNRDLDITQHLMGAMKSIAGDHRRLTSTKTEALVEDISATHDEMQLDPRSDMAPNNSVIVESQEILERVFEVFSEDSTATSVLQGLLSGDTRKETLTKCKMTDKEYGAARKRITRKLILLRSEGKI